MNNTKLNNIKWYNLDKIGLITDGANNTLKALVFMITDLNWTKIKYI